MAVPKVGVRIYRLWNGSLTPQSTQFLCPCVRPCVRPSVRPSVRFYWKMMILGENYDFMGKLWFYDFFRNRHNFWCIWWILMIFVPIESPESQLSIGPKIIKIGPLYQKLWRFRNVVSDHYNFGKFAFLKKAPPLRRGGPFSKKPAAGFWVVFRPDSKSP